jgi:SulP family sulfate permease
MSELPHCIRLVRGSPVADVAVLLITFTLTVFVDLVVAVNVGVILAALLFMRRMATSVSIDALVDDAAADLPAGSLPPDVVIFNIEGPLFFGAAEKLERTLAHIQRPATTLILRVGHMPFLDATGIFAIEEIVTDFLKHGSTVILAEARLNVLQKLERAGLLRQMGADNIAGTLPLALDRARAIAQVKATWDRLGKTPIRCAL